MAERICDNCMSRVPVGVARCPKCGIRFENTNPGGALPSGWVLAERYTIGRYVDIDGEGVTYAAIDANTLQRVVVKEFMPVTLCATRNDQGEIIPKPGCEVLFKTTRMDYQDLYTSLQRIGFSEGLVQVLDVLEANNTVYAVQEKVEGPTLAEYLTRMEEPVDATRAQALLRSVLNGVETLHAANVIHRGISPENIVLESGGTAKLTGFGTLALRQQGSELKAKLYPGFSAPEQYAASEFEGKFTDIYALGAVFYCMVTGEVPLPADERRLQDTMRTARAAVKTVPPYLSAVIARAMRLNPAERIETVGDLRLALAGEGGKGAKKGGKLAARGGDGLFGFTKQQTIMAGIALGGVALILLIIMLLVVFTKPKMPASGPSSASLSISMDEIPNFVDMDYEIVIKNSQFAALFDFPEPEYKYDKEIEEGKIISQTPVAGTPYAPTSGKKIEIKFVVSLGREPVEMPDFVTEVTLREEAIKILEEMDIVYKEVAHVNDGTYKAGQIVKTDPVAGAEVIPGKTEVLLYVASTATGKQMPGVVGLTEEAAKRQLDEAGILYSVVHTTTEYAHEVGKVIKTDPAQGAMVPAGTRVTLTVANQQIMPDLSRFANGSVDDLKAFLTERGIQFTVDPTPVANTDAALNGKVAAIEGWVANAPVTGSTVINIKVYATA